MRTSIAKTALVVMLVLFIASAVVLAHGQEQTVIPAQIYNIGTWETEHTALYSVLFYSGPQALSKLTILAAVPQNAITHEVVIAPSSAQLAPDSANNTILKWTVDSVGP